MVKKAIRLFCFGSIFTLIFSLLNLSMRAEVPRWDNFYKLPKNSIDVLFIGNSHNFYSFQPQIIDNILPIKSYVVGISAENIIVTYYELREVLMYHRPKVVVLETFVLDLDDTREYGYIFGFLDAEKWNKNRMAIAMRYLTPETGFSIFPALRYRIDWDKPYVYINQLLHELTNRIRKVNPDYSNSSIQKMVISENDYQIAKNSPTQEYAEPNPDIQVYLDKFYQLCKDNDIQLVLTTVPIVHSTPKQTKYYKPFDPSSFKELNNISEVNYDYSELNQLHFANETHINGFGSVIISIEMAKKLSQIMNLPINRTELEYYQSFLFSDYDIYREGNDFTFDLIPSYEKSSLEYKWTVQDKKKVTLYSLPWQSKSSFTTELDPYGSYEVFVEIRNLLGDYKMDADFSISDLIKLDF